jgi:PAS domain S-box-containing protein
MTNISSFFHQASNTKDVLFAIDYDWNFINITEAAEELFGVKKEEVLGKNEWSLFSDKKELDGYKKLQFAVLHKNEITINHR